jgi:adenylate cyclase
MLSPSQGARDARLAAALAEEERAGIGLAIRARLAALAVIALWVALRATGPARYYYLGIIGAFALLGVGQLLLSRRAGRGPLVAGHLLVLLDMVLLSATLVVPNPLAPEGWPVAMQLRLGNFDFFYIFIGFAVLSFSPSLALWAGLATALAWSAGVLWVLHQPGSFTVLGSALLAEVDLDQLTAVLLDPDYVSLEIWIQQVIIALVVCAILALAVARSRRLVARQATLARERANLARYFSPSRAEALARSDEPVRAVRAQPVAVLFADIMGFTRLCEHLPPEQVIALLRAFHRRMAEAVFAHGGTLEKYIGDAVMATFGTPKTGPQDALDALACCRALLAVNAEWNVARRAHGLSPVRIGIGAHYGRVVLGDIGEERCMEFAVIGDTVNVASHLESLCRELKVAIVVSDELWRQASAADPDHPALAGFTAGPARRLKGRAAPLPIWTFTPPV